jgi:hypothetical protein
VVEFLAGSSRYEPVAALISQVNEDSREKKMKKVTMKRVIAVGVLLGLALAVSPLGEDASVQAKRKKKKKVYTGTYENSVFTDKKYGFQLVISDDWNMKMMQKGNNIRFVAEKKEYSIPPAFIENEYLTTSPMVKVYADTSSLPVRNFLDSLISKSFSSEQKKEIFNSLKIFESKTKRPLISNLRLKSGIKGRRAKILRRYKLDVPRGVGELSDVITDNVQGDLTLFKTPDDKYIIIVSGICESLYYRGVNDKYFQEIIESFKFVEDEKGK